MSILVTVYILSDGIDVRRCKTSISQIFYQGIPIGQQGFSDRGGEGVDGRIL
jgi:hypothetical protein